MSKFILRPSDRGYGVHWRHQSRHVIVESTRSHLGTIEHKWRYLGHKEYMSDKEVEYIQQAIKNRELILEYLNH